MWRPPWWVHQGGDLMSTSRACSGTSSRGMRWRICISQHHAALSLYTSATLNGAEPRARLP